MHYLQSLMIVTATMTLVSGAGLVSGQTTSTGSGQAYPNKPIRIVTSPAGGSGDFVTRLIAQGISGPLGQPVIVDNRPSILIGEPLSKAPPDGYTLILVGSSFWPPPILEKLPYDPVRDFAPISMVTRAASLLVVHPSLPVKSVKELIALAKARPGTLNYSSTGVGSAGHLTTELFKAMAGVNMVPIFFKGSAQATLDLISGEVQLTFTGPASVMPQLKAGKLRALAVTSAQPSALFPSLPTVAATLPGYESAVIQGMFAPAKTPAAIITRLNQEVVRLLNQADLKEKVLNNGYESASSSPEDLGAMVQSEITKWGKVLKDAGIRAE